MLLTAAMVSTLSTVAGALDAPAEASTCNPLLRLLGLCKPTGLDPGSAPPLTIASAPPSTGASTPADPQAPCGGQTPTKDDGSAWTCTFDDEFSGSSLDGTKWMPQRSSDTNITSGSGSTTACYSDDPDNLSVSGGALNLTVREEYAPFTCPLKGNPAITTKYTGGGVSSFGKFSQTYGRFDVRAAFPASATAGLQSSLWMWPANATKYGVWPASGEMDVAEYYSGRPGYAVPNLHYLANPLQHSASKGINTTSNSFCKIADPGEFHNYTIIWTPSLISIYYDGNLCLFDHWKPLFMSHPAPFNMPFFVNLTAGVGIGANSLDGTKLLQPATTKIDYVRAWS